MKMLHCTQLVYFFCTLFLFAAQNAPRAGRPPTRRRCILSCGQTEKVYRKSKEAYYKSIKSGIGSYRVNPLTPNPFMKILHCTWEASLFTFSVHFFCLSAAQNAPPAGRPPAGGAFCAANKQKKCAEKGKKHIISQLKTHWELKG